MNAWIVLPMNIYPILQHVHSRAKENRWLSHFAVFNRIALAAGFLPSGFVKITGERFTDLSNNHPMGHYLEALHHTGYYYTFIGYAQVTAAILLLIPRTVTLGALIYFPIILNICILSLAVRFEGSLISSPLMCLACLYLLFWNYDKLKFILPFYQDTCYKDPPVHNVMSNKFPIAFFAGVATTIALVVAVLLNVYSIMPRNTLPDCMGQCSESENSKACAVFCEGIHKKGLPLDSCLNDYNKALRATGQKK